MNDMKKALESVRNEAPLVQCITNFVTVNDCANIILAAGGSPSMAHDKREVEDSVAASRALVCNMGAIEDTDAMILAGKEANRLGIPVVLDPVAVGGTQLRRDCAKRLLEEVSFTAIRGNASEIKYLAGQETLGSGVDVSQEDAVTVGSLMSTAELVKDLAKKTGSVIALSGETDIISDGNEVVLLKNGCATMSKITGSGCMVTSLIGAFCGAAGDDSMTAVCAAMAMMGIAGEAAEKKRIEKGTGNATFRTDLIDAVFNMTGDELTEGAVYEIL